MTGVDLVLAERADERRPVVEVGRDGGHLQDVDDRAVAARKVVVDDGVVAGLLEALDRVRPDVTRPACDQHVHFCNSLIVLECP
jgi:hypothetical protein